ncbi:hypothetical protein LEP1GSC132_3820 [Leptospira kirschneri str. 200803703]|uniref:Uncharacterized protein n=1 Tax=Leptospira kirschneri str. 200802841 TaxID=1193047 RepID=A0A828Y3X1_9LEPT|nr:hypothetical protein LEP1GSC044_3908 [Leptospira kirschneri serovar Grippotyphosa str. RM52]EKO52453.1 hypothetical protein LEP1GSC131_1526 [Leptospira kirschneri str. 200802841]EKQ83738.1 hypothetical protein LEP1GSC064_0976 [Leptospira kirschneri serovar Grippotyphosa str. Moskva]EKR08835.1 hypothetical protein LEP1GSC122_1340 [Leptospira kirschneri serovar Valbuzzi str. 200702274]EMK02546.1 hypothetical protein LEP1GSC176_1525 [Leptospira kirschneri str. MMD1493]EMK11873.1 hypothetical p
MDKRKWRVFLSILGWRREDRTKFSGIKNEQRLPDLRIEQRAKSDFKEEFLITETVLARIKLESKKEQKNQTEGEPEPVKSGKY